MTTRSTWSTARMAWISLLACCAVGCGATARPSPADEPVGYAELTSAPVDIETRPMVTYEGRPTYFYENHWWYRDGATWSYYRAEPTELYRQRESVQRVPRREAPAVDGRVEEGIRVGSPPERPR